MYSALCFQFAGFESFVPSLMTTTGGGKMMTTWTKEWPTERGWYWFYGQTSKIVWDMEPEYLPVWVYTPLCVGGPAFYVGGGRFLWKAKGARGLWTPMIMPTPPTDYQIDEVLRED